MRSLLLQADSGVEINSARLRRAARAFDDQQPSGLPAWYMAHGDVEAVIPGLIRIDVSGQAQVSRRVVHEYDGIHLARWRRRMIDGVLQILGPYAKHDAPKEVQHGHATMLNAMSQLLHPPEILGR